MRYAVSAAFVLGSGIVVLGQVNPEALLAKQKTVMPAAAAFSAKEGQPPHFKAYAADKTLLGYVFWSTELQPLNEVGDACNAALFAALMHKAGLALCADEPEMLATLRGVAEMNGWTRASAVPVPIARERSKSTKTAVPEPIARERSKSSKMAAAKVKPAAKKKPEKKPKAKKKKR